MKHAMDMLHASKLLGELEEPKARTDHTWH